MSVRADFSRTCDGCEYVVQAQGGKGGAMFRCSAPGAYRGRTIGAVRLEPYVPAWCPKMSSGEAYGTKKWNWT